MREQLQKLYSFSNSWTGTIIIVLFIIFFVAQAFVIPSGSMKKTLLVGDHLFVKKFSYGIPTPHIPWLEVPVLPDFRGNGHLINGEGPKREDIVVFRYPIDPKQHYVKRCVAVGGDEIIYVNNALYIHFHEGDEYIKKTYPKEKIVSLNDKLWVKNPYKDKYPGIHYSGIRNTMLEMYRHLMDGDLAMKPVFIEKLPILNPNLDFNAFYFKVKKDEYFMMGDNRDNSNDSRFWGAAPYSNIVGKPWFIYFSWTSDQNLPNDKNKYVVRWNRIGKSISSIQTDKDFIKNQ